MDIKLQGPRLLDFGKYHLDHGELKTYITKLTVATKTAKQPTMSINHFFQYSVNFKEKRKRKLRHEEMRTKINSKTVDSNPIMSAITSNINGKKHQLNDNTIILCFYKAKKK